jgi:peptidoglycan/LPS O-acetylase OafA/YrhL
MQLYVLLPLLLPVARLRPPFWAVLLAIVALTLAVYWGNRLVYRVPYTGSYVLWYTPVVLLGMWLATQTARLDAVLRRGWLLALGCAGAGLWLYLPLALDALRGQAVNTFQYQVGNWLFTTGVSFLLLAVAYWLSGREWRIVSGVSVLGRYSLQIYLLHPLILAELARWSLTSALQARFGLSLFYTNRASKVHYLPPSFRFSRFARGTARGAPTRFPLRAGGTLRRGSSTPVFCELWLGDWYYLLGLVVPFGLAWLVARAPRVSLAIFGRA